MTISGWVRAAGRRRWQRRHQALQRNASPTEIQLDFHRITNDVTGRRIAARRIASASPSPVYRITDEFRFDAGKRSLNQRPAGTFRNISGSRRAVIVQT